VHVTTFTNQPYAHSSSVLEPIRNLAGFSARTKCTDSTPSAHQKLVALVYQHGNNTPTSPDKILSHGSPQSERTVTLSPVVAGLQRLPPPEQLGLVGRRQTQNIRQCLLDDILPSLTPLLMASMHSPPQTAASQMQTHGTWEMKTYESQVFDFLLCLCVVCAWRLHTSVLVGNVCAFLAKSYGYVCLHIRTHTYAHTHVHIHIHVHTCVHVRVYAHIYMNTCIHTYICK